MLLLRVNLKPLTLKKDTDREMHVIIFIKATCIPTMYEHVFIYTRQNC